MRQKPISIREPTYDKPYAFDKPPSTYAFGKGRRGRDVGSPAPPAQILAWGTTALGGAYNIRGIGSTR